MLQASRLTLIQILINSQGLNMNPLQSLYYVSPACLLGLTIPFRAFLMLQYFVHAACMPHACTSLHVVSSMMLILPSAPDYRLPPCSQWPWSLGRF